MECHQIMKTVGIRDPGSVIRDPGSGIRDPGSGIRGGLGLRTDDDEWLQSPCMTLASEASNYDPIRDAVS